MFIAIGFVIFGFILIVTAILLVRSAVVKLRTWSETEGTVVGYRYYGKYGGVGGGAPVPEVQFVSPDGQLVSFVSTVGAGPRMYKIGAKVRVLHDPVNQGKAIIRSAFQMYALPVVAAVFGLASLGMGLGLILQGAGLIGRR